MKFVIFIFILFLMLVVGLGTYGLRFFCLFVALPIAIYYFNSEKCITDIPKDLSYEFKKIKWNNVFKKSSLVKEIINIINENYAEKIYVYPHIIIIDEKIIEYSEKNANELSIDETRILAEKIKSKLKYKNLYEIEPIVEYYERGGYGGNHFIGLTQTLDGNFVANYSNDSTTCTKITGYELILNIKNKKKIPNNRKAVIQSWKN